LSATHLIDRKRIPFTSTATPLVSRNNGGSSAASWRATTQLNNAAPSIEMRRLLCCRIVDDVDFCGGCCSFTLRLLRHSRRSESWGHRYSTNPAFGGLLINGFHNILQRCSPRTPALLRSIMRPAAFESDAFYSWLFDPVERPVAAPIAPLVDARARITSVKFVLSTRVSLTRYTASQQSSNEACNNWVCALHEPKAKHIG